MSRGFSSVFWGMKVLPYGVYMPLLWTSGLPVLEMPL